MSNKEEILITRYMRSVVAEYVDECGDVNLTALGENAADTFSLYGETDSCGNLSIPEEVFEIAYNVGQWYETNQ